MEMNIIQIKAMVVSKATPTPKINITLEGKLVKQTDKMIYLGSLKTEDGKCEKEIKRRIELARSALLCKAIVIFDSFLRLGFICT